MPTHIQSSTTPVFNFPPAVQHAKHILVKPNMGYPAQHPVVVRVSLLAGLIDQLLALRPDSTISVVEGVCTKVAAVQVFTGTGLIRLQHQNPSRVRVLDADTLPQQEYAHVNPAHAFRFKSMSAPVLLAQVDARISVAPFKLTQLNGAPLISATIKNLFGLFPRAKYHARSPHTRGQLHRPNVHQIICDAYGCIGTSFDFGIVDLHERFVSTSWQPDKGKAVPVGKVISGENLLATDLAACECVGEPACEYLQTLTQQKITEANWE